MEKCQDDHIEFLETGGSPYSCTADDSLIAPGVIAFMVHFCKSQPVSLPFQLVRLIPILEVSLEAFILNTLSTPFILFFGHNHHFLPPRQVFLVLGGRNPNERMNDSRVSPFKRALMPVI